jgi:hypothetical protein
MKRIAAVTLVSLFALPVTVAQDGASARERELQTQVETLTNRIAEGETTVIRTMLTTARLASTDGRRCATWGNMNRHTRD